MSVKALKDDSEEAARALVGVLRDLLAELHPDGKHAVSVTLDSSLDRDLGFDSLSRVELVLRIERTFGVSLSEQVLAESETPRDLLRAVLSTSATPRIAYSDQVRSIPLGEAEAAPERAETLVEVLDWHVASHPDRPHIYVYAEDAKDEHITYAQLRKEAEKVAVGLRERELQAGDGVAIMLPSGPDYFYSFYGVLLAGGVPVPIYPPVRPSQLEAHMRRHAGILSNALVRVLITMKEALVVSRLLRSQVEGLHSVVTVEELSSATPDRIPRVTITRDDIAFLQYTSGSTGNPKGVILTHANLLANIRAMGRAIDIGPKDVFVSWLPLYHDMGLIGAWFGSLYHAVPLVVMSPLAFLQRPQRWLWAIHRYRATLSAAPNFGYELCARKIASEELSGLDLSSWRVAFNGAEPVSPQTLSDFCDRFAQYGFRAEAMAPVYGLAECALGLAFPPLGRGPLVERVRRESFMRSREAILAEDDDSTALRFTACGRPLTGYQTRIVDATGQEVPERHEGRLQFQGPSATSGYFRQPDETRRLFDGEWLDTGDLAYMAGGDVFVTGRARDIIIRGGRNIYPYELEDAVGNVPDIRRGCVAVFGSPDPTSGTERVVVLAETRKVDSESLAQLRTRVNEVVNAHLGSPVEDVVLAPPHSVLKTSSGKIRRSAIRDLYERGEIGKRQSAVWWQLARLVLASFRPQLRRSMRVVSDIAYAAYAGTLFALGAVVAWLVVALAPSESLRWKFIRKLVPFLSRLCATPLSVNGLDQLPRDEPCVMVANHASYLDGIVLAGVLPIEFSFVAKVELTRNAFTRVLLTRMGTEFVERIDKQRGAADAQRIAVAARAGRSLLFFPEGTFVRMPGVLPFHLGAFLAAAEAGMSVVPIAIRGTRSILRAESWLPRRGVVRVSIGKPIVPKGSDWSAAIELRDAARAEVLQRSGEPDMSNETPPI